VPDGVISVVVPTFNRSVAVEAAALSVLQQAEQHLELVIVDDGSTDDTLERLAMIVDSRLRVLTQRNAGVSAARNAGWRSLNRESRAPVADRLRAAGLQLFQCPSSSDRFVEFDSEVPPYGNDVFATRCPVVDLLRRSPWARSVPG
jgi:glycosyltransferase involved in cell wall biosynthesis